MLKIEQIEDTVGLVDLNVMIKTSKGLTRNELTKELKSITKYVFYLKLRESQRDKRDPYASYSLEYIEIYESILEEESRIRRLNWGVIVLFYCAFVVAFFVVVFCFKLYDGKYELSSIGRNIFPLVKDTLLDPNVHISILVISNLITMLQLLSLIKK